MKRLFGTGLLVAALIMGGATPALADGHEVPVADIAPETVAAEPQTTSLTLFGTGIVLNVGVDTTGHLTTVELVDETSGDAPVDAIATKVTPHKVKFVLEDTGTKVEVKAKGKKVETKVKATSLADLTGAHQWSGKLFGDENEATTVMFTVSDVGGVPVIMLDGVTGPGDYTERTSTKTDDDEVETKLRLDLDFDGLDARISVTVEVEDDDDEQKAKLKISVRSDLFGTDRADGEVDAPEVNTPVREGKDKSHKHSDKSEKKHKKDKADKKHDADADDDDDEKHDDGEKAELEGDHDDEDEKDQHDSDDGEDD